MRKSNLFNKAFLLLFIVSVSFQAYSQSMISQDPADYPTGTTFSNCPGGSCVITLPPARINQPYEITIPITISSPDNIWISNIGATCTEIQNNHTLNNIDNTISFSVSTRCPVSINSGIGFVLNVLKDVDLEQQSFIIPIIRDSLKVDFVIDLSDNMQDTLEGNSESKLDLAKAEVYSLISKFEELQQGFGDSLAMTYFSSTVIQPNTPISDGFVAIDNTDADFNNWSVIKVYNDLDPRTPAGIAAMGEGLLNAKQKLNKDKSTDLNRIVFLFSDGLQDYGNKLKLDGVSFESTEDSLNNYSTNPKDSIIYITVTTAQAADIPPIMAAIAHNNKGLSLHVDGVTNEFTSFLDNQLVEFLDGNNVNEVATRICELSPYDDSVNVSFNENLIIDFNEDVSANSGDIVIYRASDDSEFETIDILSGNISISGKKLIINPTNEFESDSNYYVLIDENALKGKSGNNFAGITSKDYWNFTIEFIESPSDMISRNINNYPEGTVFSGDCPGIGCSITLPPIKLNETKTYTMPLVVTAPFIDMYTSTETGNCSLLNDNFTISNVLNEITIKATEKCKTDESLIQFLFHVEKSGYSPDQITVIVPIIRDTAKIALVLDLSNNMTEDISGTTENKFETLKDAVNLLMPKLETFNQVGDSLALNYYSNTVIEPELTYFPKDFIPIDDTDADFNNWSSVRVYYDMDTRTPIGNAAMGEGLLAAKSKINSDNNADYRKVVFLFSDGMQDYGNMLKLNGIEFENTNDSLNNYSTNPNDSIIYITVSTTKAADVPPIMAAIAHYNNGASLCVSDETSEYNSFINNELVDILDGKKATEVATRICGLSPYNDSINIQFDTDLTVEFNEDVTVNTGNVVIYRTADDSEFETADVTSGKISGNNTSTITISLDNEFESETEYYVLIDENAFEGTSGNLFAGITSKSYWSFTSEDNESPTVVLSTENTTVTESQFDIDITFSEEVIGFEQTDIILTNGSVQSFSSTNNIVFSSEIKAIEEGDLTISVGADAAEDLAGNLNETSNLLTVTYNNTTGINDLNAKEVKIYSLKGSVIVELVNFELNTLQNAYAEVYSLNGSLISKKEINENYNKLKIEKDIKYGIVKVVINGKLYSNEVLISQ